MHLLAPFHGHLNLGVLREREGERLRRHWCRVRRDREGEWLVNGVSGTVTVVGSIGSVSPTVPASSVVFNT